MIPAVLTDKNIEVLLYLSDAIIYEFNAADVKPYLHKDFPLERLDEYVVSYPRPSKIPEFKEIVLNSINSAPKGSTQSFIILMAAFNSRILAPALTGTLTLIRDMTLKQREDLLRSWRDSPFAIKRRLFKMVFTITAASYAKIFNDLHNLALGFPGRESRDVLYEDQVIDDFVYNMTEKPKVDGNELYLPNIDVLIIGSGSGAGVVAHTLSESGHTSLILEKGKYYKNSEFNFDYNEGQTLFEGNGTLASSSQDIFIVAGSTFGGGSTVNWSACLKTPFKVRKEWYDEYGIDWAASEQFDKHLDYVWKKMGATKENIDHSLTNKVILEGSTKLGYAAKEVEQNNGVHPNHDCGMCHLGCKFGVKQGSTACWFREALANGAQFMDQVRVIEVLHKNNVAYGVLCQDKETNVVFKITGPKKIVVCGGSLSTPVVLQNSGFKNRHIGANLKLHPVTVLFGDFGKEVESKPHAHPILTSVCTEVDDLDGKAHGAKIEAILHAPYLESTFFPWNGSDGLRKDTLKYNLLATLLLITRDQGSGFVSGDKAKPDAFNVDYSVNKYDRNALLQAALVGADLLYIEGAKEIISPQPWHPRFHSEKPKHERSITDTDYVEWRQTISRIPFDTFGASYGSAHQMSSCRMSGKGPKYGACDQKGRLFECKNIYIADASAMPTASGANPMITTMAIARLVALGIVNDLQPQPKI